MQTFWFKLIILNGINMNLTIIGNQEFIGSLDFGVFTSLVFKVLKVDSSFSNMKPYGKRIYVNHDLKFCLEGNRQRRLEFVS